MENVYLTISNKIMKISRLLFKTYLLYTVYGIVESLIIQINNMNTYRQLSFFIYSHVLSRKEEVVRVYLTICNEITKISRLLLINQNVVHLATANEYY